MSDFGRENRNQVVWPRKNRMTVEISFYNSRIRLAVHLPPAG
jgi:hypothetical protein